MAISKIFLLGVLASVILSGKRNPRVKPRGRLFGIVLQPPQPPIVTLICRDAEKNVPSLSLATAITS
jgi:hypothetical protein